MYEEHYHLFEAKGEKYPQSIYHNTPTEELKCVGNKDVLRVDAGIKVRGRNVCANDICMAGMLYVRFKLCPHSHAIAKNIDTSKAWALPGVVDVLTHADIPDLRAASPDEYVLMEKLYHDNEEVAAVLAEEEDIAEEACTLIDVDYEVLPFVLYAEDALKDEVVLRGDTNLGGDPWSQERGSVEDGFNEADVIVGPTTYGLTKPLWSEDRVRADLEGDADTCLWDGERLIHWSFEKGKFGPHRTISSALNLPFNKVVFPPCYQGPVYGGTRGGHFKNGLLAAYLAKKHERCVKSRFTVEQQLCCKGNQKAQILTMKAGVKNDGTVTAMHIADVMNMGSRGGDSSSAINQTRSWVKTANFKTEGMSATTNTPPRGNIRCTTHPNPNTKVGIFLDRVAESADMDPADFIIHNMPTESGIGQNPDNLDQDCDVNPRPELMQKLLQVSNWKSRWKGWNTPVSVNGPKQRGVGIGLWGCTHGQLSNPESALLIANRSDGTFKLNCGSHDIGQGSRTALALIAAEELGVAPDQVVMSRVDTGLVQESRSPGGSTVTRGSGTAVVLAAREMKYEMFRTAIKAGDIEANSPEELETKDGFIYLRANPDTKVEISEVLAGINNALGPIMGRGFFSRASGRYLQQWSGSVVEVEVDTDTGEIGVVDVNHVMGIGRVIWYKGAYNQVIGGVEMALGRVLYETLSKDEVTGITLNPNYLDFKIPTIMDSPNISVDFHEQITNYGPLGAVGIGEPIVGAPGIATLNAIYNACGVRIIAPPATPEKILAGLGKA